MATDEVLAGQYSVVAPFLQAYRQTWLDEENSLRVASYKFYEQLYWNDAGGFQLTLRGDEEFPIYVPSARRVVNTLNRYVARDMGFAVEAETDAERVACVEALGDLFKRERFFAKFKQSKLYALMHGDWVFYVEGDPTKPEGSRLSLSIIDAAKYFPIQDPNDVEKTLGAMLIEQVTIETKLYVKRQRWLKPTHPEHPNYQQVSTDPIPIAHDVVTLEQENWNDPAKAKKFGQPTDVDLDILPGITAIPLYHARIQERTGTAFGNSILKGLERLFFGVNQAATDEDVALAMAGLGMYKSDSSPVDEDGNSVDWILGPRRVVEIPVGGVFERVSGIASIEASQGHIAFLQGQAESTFGLGDISFGQVDVGVAASGIALALRLAPVMDASADIDVVIGDTITQFWHDIVTMWMPTYEGQTFPTAEVTPVFGDKVPQDKEIEFQRLMTLYSERAISRDFLWDALVQLGYDIDKTAMAAQLEEETALADPVGDRLATEANADPAVDDAQL